MYIGKPKAKYDCIKRLQKKACGSMLKTGAMHLDLILVKKRRYRQDFDNFLVFLSLFSDLYL